MFQEMNKYTFFSILSLIVFILAISSGNGLAQYNFKNAEIFQFQKQEINWGLHYYAGSEREETRTEFWREYEELTTGAVKFQLKSRLWNFLENNQERFEFNL